MKISRPPTDWKPNGEWSLSWDVLLGIARQLLDPEVAPVPVEDHLASLLYAIDPEPQLVDGPPEPKLSEFRVERCLSHRRDILLGSSQGLVVTASTPRAAAIQGVALIVDEWEDPWQHLRGGAECLVRGDDGSEHFFVALDLVSVPDLASDYFLLGEKDQHGPEPVMVSPQTIRREALSVLAKIEEVLDAYSWDHNSARPTDPTVVLPLVRRALALASFEEDEARKAAHPGRGEA